MQGRAVRAADVADSNSNWPSLPLSASQADMHIILAQEKMTGIQIFEELSLKITIMSRETSLMSAVWRQGLKVKKRLTN